MLALLAIFAAGSGFLTALLEIAQWIFLAAISGGAAAGMAEGRQLANARSQTTVLAGARDAEADSRLFVG